MNFLFLTIIVLLIGIPVLLTKRKDNFGLLAGGLIIGVFIEFFFEYSWSYCDCLRPFLWRDVSLIIILGWGAITYFALSISSLVSKKIKPNSELISFISDIVIIQIMLIINEQLMSHFKFWTYQNDIHPHLFAQLIGFLLLSVIITSTARYMEKKGKLIF